MRDDALYRETEKDPACDEDKRSQKENSSI